MVHYDYFYDQQFKDQVELMHEYRIKWYKEHGKKTPSYWLMKPTACLRKGYSEIDSWLEQMYIDNGKRVWIRW